MHTIGLVRRSRGGFGHDDPALFVHGYEVGERPPDISSDTITHAGLVDDQGRDDVRQRRGSVGRPDHPRHARGQVVCPRRHAQGVVQDYRERLAWFQGDGQDLLREGLVAAPCVDIRVALIRMISPRCPSENVRSTGVCPLLVTSMAHHTWSPEVTGSLTGLNRTLMSPEISSSTAGVMRTSKTPETTTPLRTSG